MRIVKTAVCVILAVFIFFGVFGGIAMLSARGLISDPEALAEKLADDEYDAKMRETVSDDIDLAVLLLSLDKKTFDANVSGEDIDAASHAMISALMHRILRGGDRELPAFESEKLLDAIRRDIADYAAEHELIAEEGAAEEVYEYIYGRVTDQIRVISESYLEKIPDLNGVQKWLSVWYVPFCAAAFFAVIIFVIRRKEILRALNAVTIPVYAASFTGYVVFRILEVKDYLTKVSLEQSMLRELLIRIYRVGVSSFRRCFGIALIASLVLLVADIVLISIFGTGKRKQEAENAPTGKEEGGKTAPEDAAGETAEEITAEAAEEADEAADENEDINADPLPEVSDSGS